MAEDLMDDRRCTATAKGSGQRCKRSAIPGGTVCAKHGGSAPQVRDAADRRRQDRDALLAAERFGLPREVDPHTALLEELHRTAGAVQWLGAVVADLEQDRITAGGSATAYVELWQVERKHLVDVARECIRAGIEERRVRLAESAGAQLAAVIRAVLERLMLTAEQQSVALVVVPEELRRVSELPAGPGGGEG